MAASHPRLWRFSSRIDDRGEWHQVEVVRVMRDYVLVSRDFAGRPARGDVGNVCIARVELETTGRAWCRRARESFFTDQGRADEERRMREGVP